MTVEDLQKIVAGLKGGQGLRPASQESALGRLADYDEIDNLNQESSRQAQQQMRWRSDARAEAQRQRDYEGAEVSDGSSFQTDAQRKAQANRAMEMGLIGGTAAPAALALSPLLA